MGHFQPFSLIVILIMHACLTLDDIIYSLHSSQLSQSVPKMIAADNSLTITVSLTSNSTRLLCILFLLIPFATPLTFDFPNFPYNINTLSLEGDAYFEGQFLRLTLSGKDEPPNKSVGRATHNQPFLLREKATGKLADFTTSFTFVIDSQTHYPYADGLALFLAPKGSSLNRTLGQGGSLGLAIENPEASASRAQYPVVAIEFDIFQNTMQSVDDPVGDHVGIDVNSLKSLITKPWEGGIADAQVNSATVSYDSKSKNLSVAYTNYVNGSQVMIRYLDYMVDLNRYLPDCVIVGISGATGLGAALHKITSWNFTSTSLADEINAKKSASLSSRIALAGGFSVVGCIIFVGGLVLAWIISRKKREGESDRMFNYSMEYEFEKGTGPRKFPYSELARATSNFVEGEKLGEGGFGAVYKGFIKDLNSYVAVKRSKGSQQGLKEYAAEVRIISRIRHRNLVQLIGWCHEKRQLLLVYEFMPNGSLDFHLFKAKNLLIWEVRYRIALGLASGLFYLHEGWEQCVLHRDIKSSNVMLDSNFSAKLGDFGLARLVDHGEQYSPTTNLAGTMGYMAPEYVTTGKASKQSDVYSFGVVALEIACGRKPSDPKFESSQVSMMEWVWELYREGKVLEAADRKLGGDFDEKQIERLLIVGLWCAHLNYNIRPSIQRAIQVLKFEDPLPILPSNMSMISTYFAPFVSHSMWDCDTTTSGRGETQSEC